MFRIRLQLKDKGVLVSEKMSEPDADAALAGEIAKKLGTMQAIVLPGVTVQGDQLVGAQKIPVSNRSLRAA